MLRLKDRLTLKQVKQSSFRDELDHDARTAIPQLKYVDQFHDIWVLVWPGTQLLQQAHFADASLDVAFPTGHLLLVLLPLNCHKLITIVGVFCQVYYTIGALTKHLDKTISAIEQFWLLI